MANADITLYTTPGCHLCEHAEHILVNADVPFVPVDIAEDADLIKRYGVRIPVLRDREGRELGWPFDGTGLAQWLAGVDAPGP